MMDMKVCNVRNEANIVKNSDTISAVHSTAERNSAQIKTLSEKVEEQQAKIKSQEETLEKRKTTMANTIKTLKAFVLNRGNFHYEVEVPIK